MEHIKLCSGFGVTHSSSNKPLSTVIWDEITALIDCPQDVEKSKSQWVIPSTLASRRCNDQEEAGKYWMLWADIDHAPPSVSELAKTVEGIVEGCRFEVYTTKSATEDNQKSRILIPLGKKLSPQQWLLCQEILNDQLELSLINPDRSSEKLAQLLFLPNRGEHYESQSIRVGPYFDPLEAFSSQLVIMQEAIKAKELAIAETIHNAKLKRPERLAQGFKSPIAAFNVAYLVEEILIQSGYDQRGDLYRHPNSESGSFSASVKGHRVHTLSTADPLYTGGGGVGAHDAFSAFMVLWHNNDLNAAIKDACNNWLNGWNEENAMSANTDDFDDDTSPLEKLQSYAANGKSGEMMAQMMDDEYVLEGIAIMGQWTNFYAAPNTGKTLITLAMLIEQVKAGKLNGGNVYYVNADDNYRGAVEKLEILEAHGIQVLIPNQNYFDNSKMNDLVDNLTRANQATGQVIVLDTLKKFTDLMDKKVATEFGKLARSFVGAGGTIITLAHTNKNRNDEGKRVFGGTSDILDDCDCGYVIDGGGPNADDQYRATFENIKSRGDVAQKVTFKFTKAAGCSYEQLLISVERLGSKAVKEAEEDAKLHSDIQADKPLVGVIILELANDELLTKDILDKVIEVTTHSRRTIKRVLLRWTGNNYDEGHRWTARKGDKNQMLYQKLPNPVEVMVDKWVAIDRAEDTDINDFEF
jgi:hypothetical protein